MPASELKVEEASLRQTLRSEAILGSSGAIWATDTPDWIKVRRAIWTLVSRSSPNNFSASKQGLLKNRFKRKYTAIFV